MTRLKGTLQGRIIVAVSLFLPLYAIPTAARFVLWSAGLPVLGIVLSDAFGALCAGFVTNNFRFGLLLYAGFTVLEFALAGFVRSPLRGLWLGDLAPALVTVYFAQRLYVNLGV